MGLEIAELMLGIEERYAVEIDEDDVKDMQTFGDLVDLVKRKIDEPLRPEIAESSREIILASLLAELRTLLPMGLQVDENTKLNELERFRSWCRPLRLCKERPSGALSTYTNYLFALKSFTLKSPVEGQNIWSVVRERFPELPPDGKPPRCYEVHLSCTDFLVADALWLAIVVLLGSKLFAGVYALYGIVFCVGLPVIWRVLSLVRRRARTLGDVAGEIAEKRQKRLRASRLSSDDVENELRAYICEAFGFKKPEDIRRESGLFTDLGLG